MRLLFAKIYFCSFSFRGPLWFSVTFTCSVVATPGLLLLFVRFIGRINTATPFRMKYTILTQFAQCNKLYFLYTQKFKPKFASYCYALSSICCDFDHNWDWLRMLAKFKQFAVTWICSCVCGKVSYFDVCFWFSTCRRYTWLGVLGGRMALFHEILLPEFIVFT